MNDNSTNVTPIDPRSSRPRREFQFPKAIEKVLADNDLRVAEARAVAKVASFWANQGQEAEAIEFCFDAILRLLEPVSATSSPNDLFQQAEDRGLELDQA